MKQTNRLALLCFCAAVMLAGCTRYGTAITEIKSYNYKDNQLTVTAEVTDNGGCQYYVEQGFCYRQDTFPFLNDVFTTQVKVNDYSENAVFSSTFSLPIADTTYYVRAYVKNNAGLSYSDVVKVSTNALDYMK